MVNKRYVAFCLYFAVIDMGFAQCASITREGGVTYLVNSCNFTITAHFCYDDDSPMGCGNGGGVSNVKANSRTGIFGTRNNTTWHVSSCKLDDWYAGKCEFNAQSQSYQQTNRGSPAQQNPSGTNLGDGQYQPNPNASRQNNTQRQQQLNNAMTSLQQYGAALDRDRDARRAKELADLREQERSEAVRKKTLELEVERDVSTKRNNPITNPF